MTATAVATTSTPAPARPRRTWVGVLIGVLLVVLGIVSLFVGVSDVSVATLLEGGADGTAAFLLVASRMPRTVAVVLVGASLGIAGLILQMLVRNKFVEPGTTGVSEFATLGMLVTIVLWPGMAIMGKMAVAAVFGLIGTWVFLRVIRAVPVRQLVLVPLVGIMLGGIVGAVTAFFAYRLDLLQSLGQWSQGSFASVMQGRYEYVWVAAVMVLVAWVAADRFSVIGLGEDFATNLGLNYRRVVAVGMVVVAVITASVLVTAGMIPFLGLVVPNIVSLIIGDNVRRSIPWVAGLGATFVLACDLIARTVRFPYEIPLSVVVGIVGAGLFLWLLLRKGSRAH
ncbi:iron chelate uptake ABC transporter family permease subunit [Microbacterium sp. zg.Y1090]|uniref:ABC transporter permease n=1 Tax=Microbacterium TaxID=33882 RepID=UPI00214C297C|nr:MULTISPECIES: iron chelate uptake ABC transporter family permease subunit [unclassified Microbacterium]MCR2812484.1 iron chelate uptake ABC transporter family permease subunit [Microbacterium sp. zg.Y1084]MCR2817715.1 iron chelate uptake ABC transporter family permease subunit [Microbacterium sp. zg.Y1090]MDL5485642.1 iron chelate uptake ABC transporter family permease subunit [Microbacterium sp. zg-Y1211]WIM28813.1 iron chelate uptake ABC transporter family permease subunit [Microbacterium 